MFACYSEFPQVLKEVFKDKELLVLLRNTQQLLEFVRLTNCHQSGLESKQKIHVTCFI